MYIFNFFIQRFFEDVGEIEQTFRQSIKLKLIKEEDLPYIPNKDECPHHSLLYTDINSGKFANRIASYSITESSKKKCDSLYPLADQDKFIEISSKDIDKKGNYTFCRAAKLQFSEEVKTCLTDFGQIYIYAMFDSFDLKIGTDLRIKSVVLTPLEMKQIKLEKEKIKQWNEAIFNVKNTFTRLKYRISENEFA